MAQAALAAMPTVDGPGLDHWFASIKEQARAGRSLCWLAWVVACRAGRGRRRGGTRGWGRPVPARRQPQESAPDCAAVSSRCCCPPVSQAAAGKPTTGLVRTTYLSQARRQGVAVRGCAREGGTCAALARTSPSLEPPPPCPACQQTPKVWDWRAERRANPKQWTGAAACRVLAAWQGVPAGRRQGRQRRCRRAPNPPFCPQLPAPQATPLLASCLGWTRSAWATAPLRRVRPPAACFALLPACRPSAALRPPAPF